MREQEQTSRKLAKRLRREMPNAEVILWSRLKGRRFNRLHFRRQHPIGPYVADFACVERMSIVELDGDQHALPSAVAHDRMRDGFIGRQGWKIIRIANAAIYEDLAEALEYLWRELQIPPPSLRDTSPARGGGKEMT